MFRLTNPPAEPNVCVACGKVVKDMSRHAGSAACAMEGKRALVARLGLTEVWHSEKGVLRGAQISVTEIRDQRGKRKQHGRSDGRRWYAPERPVKHLRLLRNAGVKEQRLLELLRGPEDKIERELAVAALAQLARDVARTG